MVLRTPLLSLVAVVTIGLGVGGVTFAFSVVHATLLGDLPVRDPERLMVLWETRVEEGQDQIGVPLGDFLDLRERQTSFEQLGAFYSGTVNLAGDEGPPERYQGGFVTAATLSMLAVPPLLGRLFREGDDVPGAPALVLLGHQVWRTRFAADPAVVGRSVRVNGESAEIIGVMPEGFRFPFNEDLWVPNRADPALFPRRGGTSLQVAGYLREGVALEAALAELETVAAGIETEHPEENRGISMTAQPFKDGYTPSQITMMLSLMMAMVVGVLLVACANVANVLLARSVVREREVAVRSALGAGRWRVIRQMLTEVVVLGVLGGLLGLGVAWLSLGLLEAGIQDIQKPYWIVFRLDTPVLLFTSLVTLLAALGAGLFPAVRASGADMGTMLRDESRGSSSLRVGRFTGTLVVAELAVSCGLMIAAGLLVRTLFDLNSLDLGVRTEGVMTVRIGLFESDYPDPDARNRFYRELLELLRSQPGVEAATLTTILPGTGAGRGLLEVDGQSYGSDAERPRASASTIDAAFFETFGLTLLEGRAFERDEIERGGEPVAVVSRSFADVYLGGNALGRSIRMGGAASERPWMGVVGVVADVHPGVNPFDGGGELRHEAVYLPLGGEDPRFVSVAVRTARPEQGPPAIRSAVAAADPDMPIYFVRTMQEAIDQTTAFHRIFSSMFAVFGAVALFLAAVGLYGVMDFSVSSRLREMGVRAALGAGRGAILRLVLGRMAAQLGLGVSLGIGIGLALAAPLSSTLFGVEAWDALVYGGIVGTLVATGVLATLFPAIRALGVDPVVALRAS
jgi:predicted permease